MQSREELLLEILSHVPQANYPHLSRVHSLRTFSQHLLCHAYVKRDDELGFGISGSKIRKYRSLLPFLCSQELESVVVIGSAYSNHVVSIVQLLIENGIQPILFLRGHPERAQQGNNLFIQLFCNNIHWIPKDRWPYVEQLAQEYVEKRKSRSFILPEGGSSLEAIPGTLSLSLDIARNEKELGLDFDHIWIESGTGMMASSLILGYAWMRKPTQIHVLLLAGDEAYFLKQLRKFHQGFEQLIQQQCSWPENFILHTPRQLVSFGSTNSFIFREIQRIAQEEGFLTDPIYTAKLFIEAKQWIKESQIAGNVLIHHSGGALTLTGFQNQLKVGDKELTTHQFLID